MKRQQLQTMYGATPDSFKTAVRRGLSAARAQQAHRRPLRVSALAAAALLALMGVAYAAFPSQVAEWFGRSYGKETENWLREGKADRPNNAVTAGGAVFTLEEVAQRGRGLYAVGTVTLPEGSKDVLIAEDQSVTEPFGYDVHGAGGEPETAPDGTPTLIEKAEKQGGKLLMAIFRLDLVGVDGGEMLTPDCVGYETIPQRDGSLRVMFEVEDGVAVEEGDACRLSLRASVREMEPDGTVKNDTKVEQRWDVDITPQPVRQ